MTQSSFLSKRARNLKPSLTLEISAKAKALTKEGKDICSLSAGEPDFDTPEFIIEAALKALKDGYTRYGPAAGDPELREAIAFKQTTKNHSPTKADNVLITNGGKQAIFNLLQIILNPGDEVLIPSPYWLSYPEIVRLAGAIPINIKTHLDNQFRLNIEELESKVNERTRLLIINSPNNPTGHVMSKEELEDIASFLRRHQNLLIMSDEIYELLLARNEIHYSFSAIAPDLSDRVFTVNGFAKGWAMTGWRVGYLIGQSEVIKKAIALQSQSTSNVCSFAQRGALAAIQSSEETVNRMIGIYNKRRSLLSEGLNSIEGIKSSNPKGAFYSFPRILTASIGSIELCNLALDKFGLAMVPGLAFGDDSSIRLSCAVKSITINDGIQRLNKLVSYLNNS